MSYNGNDFMKASKLANELKFEEVNITDNHMETSLVLFMDENNGTWSVDGSYNGRYRLCYEYDTVCVIGKDLEAEIDGFIEAIRNADEIEENNMEEFRMLQDELWRNYGYGKN